MVRSITFNNSKAAVNRAGVKLAKRTALEVDIKVIENWRAAHNYVLNTFQSNLRNKAKAAGVRTPVQRIKRLATITGKLNRFSKMKLARMHDIVGCRVVFDDYKSLVDFRANFNKSRFEHKRRTMIDGVGNEEDIYNYIRHPKKSGYRGIHDVFEYKAKQGSVDRTSGGSRWNGLLIEIQYRTSVQHAWATAVEICDSYTQNHGKFSDAPKDYLEYFQLASEILARGKEDMTSCLPNMTNSGLIARFNILEKKHGMLKVLRGIQPNVDDFDSNKHMLLITSISTGQTQVKTYSKFDIAVEEYFLREKDSTLDVVLVAADDSESVRFGFKNYFSDAREFVSMMDDSIKHLT